MIALVWHVCVCVYVCGVCVSFRVVCLCVHVLRLHHECVPCTQICTCVYILSVYALSDCALLVCGVHVCVYIYNVCVRMRVLPSICMLRDDHKSSVTLG